MLPDTNIACNKQQTCIGCKRRQKTANLSSLVRNTASLVWYNLTPSQDSQLCVTVVFTAECKHQSVSCACLGESRTGVPCWYGLINLAPPQKKFAPPQLLIASDTPVTSRDFSMTFTVIYKFGRKWTLAPKLLGLELCNLGKS